MAEKATTAPIRYNGRALIRSANGIGKDILSVVLQPEKQYSTDEVKKLVNQFLKKEVLSHGGKLDGAE